MIFIKKCPVLLFYDFDSLWREEGICFMYFQTFNIFVYFSCIQYINTNVTKKCFQNLS